jgi:glycosyltransferase involved in cell wall biosynthesis
LGLARFGRARGIPVITRAHGYDLYEARHDPPYIPFRRAALEIVDRVYPDSDAGAGYLTDRYPTAAPSIEPALLGVEDPGFLTAPSSDGVFRIMSCSFLSPVKRIDLLIQGLARLGADLPGTCVSWTHIGDGPEKRRLSEQAASTLPSNVRWDLRGYPGKQGLYEFYRANPVDLFVNVSESEGTPVSLMEALSVGIPVLCTAVGGNIEVVGNGNGLLVAANPSPEELSKGLAALSESSEQSVGRRTASRMRWQQRYNANENYAKFAASVLGVEGGRVWKKSRAGK